MIKIDEVEVYDLDEVAKKLSVNKRTVMKYLKNGDLKGKKITGKWFVSKENLKKYLTE